MKRSPSRRLVTLLEATVARDYGALGKGAMQRDDASVGRVTESVFCAASLRLRSNAWFLSKPTS